MELTLSSDDFYDDWKNNRKKYNDIHRKAVEIMERVDANIRAQITLVYQTLTPTEIEILDIDRRAQHEKAQNYVLVNEYPYYRWRRIRADCIAAINKLNE